VSRNNGLTKLLSAVESVLSEEREIEKIRAHLAYIKSRLKKEDILRKDALKDLQLWLFGELDRLKASILTIKPCFDFDNPITNDSNKEIKSEFKGLQTLSSAVTTISSDNAHLVSPRPNTIHDNMDIDNTDSSNNVRIQENTNVNNVNTSDQMNSVKITTNTNVHTITTNVNKSGPSVNMVKTTTNFENAAEKEPKDAQKEELDLIRSQKEEATKKMREALDHVLSLKVTEEQIEALRNKVLDGFGRIQVQIDEQLNAMKARLESLEGGMTQSSMVENYHKQQQVDLGSAYSMHKSPIQSIREMVDSSKKSIHENFDRMSSQMRSTIETSKKDIYDQMHQYREQFEKQFQRQESSFQNKLEQLRLQMTSKLQDIYIKLASVDSILLELNNNGRESK